MMRIAVEPVAVDVSDCGTLDPRIARRRAVLGLGLLVVLVVVGHWVASWPDEQGAQDAAQVHIAQRQATGSQRIAKLALAIQATESGPTRDRLASELAQFLAHWDRAYHALRAGRLHNRHLEHSAAIEGIYFELTTAQWGLLCAAQDTTKLVRAQGNRSADLRKPIADILRFEREILEGIERLVVQYEQEAAARRSVRQTSGRLWLSLVVGLLAVGGWMVLRSVVAPLDRAGRRLDQLSSELLAARRLAGAVSSDYKRLSSVVQSELRPTIAALLTACDRAEEESDSALAREQLAIIDDLGRRLMRRLNEIVPAKASSVAIERVPRLVESGRAAVTEKPLAKENELLACIAPQSR